MIGARSDDTNLGKQGTRFDQSTGDFYCPDCSTKKDYNHQVVKRWFTFFFIPIFPYSRAGDYVECQSCNSTFNTRVLEFDPEKEQAKFEAAFSIAAKRVMFKMALADGEIDDKEIDQIVRGFSNIAKREIEREDIAAELEAARADERSVEDFLREVAPSLNDGGKEIVLRSAIAVAKADETLDPSEIAELHRLALAVDLPRPNANGIFIEEGVPKM